MHIAHSKTGMVVRHAADGRIVETRSLADPESAKDMEAFRRKISKSPAAASTFLKDVGILTPTGRLSRRFGGK